MNEDGDPANQPAFVPKEPKEEPLFSNEEPQQNVVGEAVIKEEEMSDDGRFSSLSSPTHCQSEFSRSMAPGPVEVKEEEIEAEDEIKKEPKKDKRRTQKTKETLFTAEGEERRRSSRIASRPKKYTDFLADGYNEPSHKKSRAESEKDIILEEETTEVNEKEEEAGATLHPFVTQKFSFHGSNETDKESLITTIECEVKSKSAEIDNLKNIQAKNEEVWKYRKGLMENEVKSKSEEIEKLKRESDAKTAEMEKEINMKLAEIDYLRIAEANAVADWNSRITQMDNEVKMKSKEIENNEHDIRVAGEKNKEQIAQLEKKVGELTSRLGEERKDKVKERERIAEGWQLQQNPTDMQRLNDQNGEIVIRAKFAGIAKLKRRGVVSEPTVRAGVPWTVSVQNDNYGIVCILVGERTDEIGWTDLIRAEFRVISQKSMEFDLKSEMTLLPYAETKNSGSWIERISLKDLFDEKKGLMKDDSINIAVTIRGIPTD